MSEAEHVCRRLSDLRLQIAGARRLSNSGEVVQTLWYVDELARAVQDIAKELSREKVFDEIAEHAQGTD